METFLKRVASHLYNNTSGDLAHTAVVFPNKRAALFFNEYLAQEAGQPIWSPAYISISELFCQCSELQIGDPIKLVCDLYKVFREATDSEETLDSFYAWGELLISDFDDADKNMADTKSLFSNLHDLNELSCHTDFLEPEQLKALQLFFKNFKIDDQTELKNRFSKLWDKLGEIYEQFRLTLQQQGLAYEGMLYRQVIEQFDCLTLPYEHYVFVGFNVLNKVEHTLFRKLNEAGMASFYWDYDQFYLNKCPHEAGEFIRRNLKDFPSGLPQEFFCNMEKPKEITFVESPTENAQIRYLPEWINKHLTKNEKETAVVLCNEALLPSVMHALSDDVKHINITMGFPLAQTPTMSFVTSFLQLQTEGSNPINHNFRYEEVLLLLKHPYTMMLTDKAASLAKELTDNNRFFPKAEELQQDEVLKLLFSQCADNATLCEQIAELLKRIAAVYNKQSHEADNQAFDQLYREALFKAYTQINRFHNLIDSKELTVTASTFVRLITKVLSSDTIPFHGEPAIGMQVMGVLETRNLDFRHLILLSTNEGQLPKAGSDASFIPYNLRKAFGMTTIDHKIAVFAYYFYRLLQRAEKVTLAYTTVSDAMNKGEMSRFMLQFLIEWNQEVRRVTLKTPQSPQDTESICIQKTPEIMKRMQSIYDVRVNPKALISPSALNCYIDCPLMFYFRYVAQLKPLDEASTEIDSALFGTIFHEAAEQIYNDLAKDGKEITQSRLEAILEKSYSPLLEDYVHRAFNKHFFKQETNTKPEYNGTQYINSRVIYRYIRQLLEKDVKQTPFTYVGSEQKITEDIKINTPKGAIHSRIGGYIDRMECKRDTLYIVDYKTGGDSKTLNEIEKLFTPDEKRAKHIFQILLYCSLMCRKADGLTAQIQKVAPKLIYIHKAATEDYSPLIQVKVDKKNTEMENFLPYHEEYRARLQELLEEIFHPDLSFDQTDNEKTCAYCDYKDLCRKKI